MKTKHATMAVCIAAALSLAVAMGVGRFAFTPLFPLMFRDGLLHGNAGAWLAASNYLGYLLGAMVAGRLPLRPVHILGLSLIGICLLTGAMGLTHTLALWALLRLVSGVLSAWALVATSAWALGWLAAVDRAHLAGAIYAGVGLGIALAGLFCLAAAQPGVSANTLWIELSLLAAVATVAPLVLSQRHAHAPVAPLSRAASQPTRSAPAGTTGLVVSYGLFGFGYILPATYLPQLARHLVDNPAVFGWAWPLFGLAALLSTLLTIKGLQGVTRLRVWSVSHVLMAGGVLLPSLWPTLTSITAAALLVGGTFMVITMVGMQEARERTPHNPSRVLGRMTAAFALGQLAGPLLAAALSRLSLSSSSAFNLALQLAAASLLLSAGYLWRANRPRLI